MRVLGYLLTTELCFKPQQVPLTTESFFQRLLPPDNSQCVGHSQSPPRSGRYGMGDLSSPPYTRELNGKSANTRNGPIWEKFVKSLLITHLKVSLSSYLEDFYLKLSERAEFLIIRSVSHMGLESQMQR